MSRRVYGDGIYVVHGGGGSRRIFGDGVYAVFGSFTPEPPIVEADQIGGSSARIAIIPITRHGWKIRIRLSSTLAVVYTSDEISGEDDFFQIPSGTLGYSTEYEVSGAILFNGIWSEWGNDYSFTTDDNVEPTAPGSWLEPTDGSLHNESVSLISDPATDPDGDDDDLTYETWFSADGAAWEMLGGNSLTEVHELSFAAGTVLEYRRRATDGYDYGPYGSSVTITVDAVPVKPVLLYVELTAPGEVRGVMSEYLGDDTHESSRYQIQEKGGDWTGVDMVDTGFVGGGNLLISPVFDSLSSGTYYEMRAQQRYAVSADSEWSDAVEFSPLDEETSFDESSPFSGFTGDLGAFEVLEVPGTHGGKCLVDKGAGSLVWTGGGLTQGFSARMMNHWSWEHSTAPIVLRGGLGHTLRFWISPGVGGYSFEVDFYRQRIFITRRTASGHPFPTAWIYNCDLPPDRWNTISVSVVRASKKTKTVFSLNPPPILTSARFSRNCITVSVNGQAARTIMDSGFQDGSTWLYAEDVPVSGFVGFHMGLTGAGMRRLDYLVSGSGVAMSEMEVFATVGVSTIKVPSITRPRAGEVFDASMTLNLGAADTYQVSDDGGETWGADVVYSGSTTVDVSGWSNGYEYMIRAKRGSSAWTYTQKFSVDHRASPICFHRYFGDEEWERPVTGTTPIWNMTENWQIISQYERNAIPDTALTSARRGLSPSALIFDEFSQARNGEVRALLRNYHDIAGAGVFGRGSGESDDAAGYWASCVRGWHNRLYLIDGTDYSYLAGIPSLRHGAPMMVAMRIVEGTIGVKHWVADAREPDEWMTVREDATIDEIGEWGIACAGYWYRNAYPGSFESVSFVNLDEEVPTEIIPEPGVAEITEKAWAFVLDGHTFYVLNRFDAPALICDLSTGQWHEWFTDLPPTTVDGESYWNMHRGIMWKGRVIACDLSDPIIWELDPNSFDDQETLLIRRAVSAVQPFRGSHSRRQGSLRVTARREDTDITTRVVMRFSDDGGRTWSREYDVSFESDAYSKRIEYRSLGRVRAPGRIWDITDAGGLVRIEGVDSDTEEDDG